MSQTTKTNDQHVPISFTQSPCEDLPGLPCGSFPPPPFVAVFQGGQVHLSGNKCPALFPGLGFKVYCSPVQEMVGEQTCRYTRASDANMPSLPLFSVGYWLIYNTRAVQEMAEIKD